ncbi:metalloprotease m41 ftsh [Holotrichia oblita]|nr:metalloprotease m41 ftsh [Holotrichia oblita]
MKTDIERILVTEDEIKEMVRRLGRKITGDYQGKELVVVGILKGGFIFMADLIREIDLIIKIDFMSVSSYGASTRSTGIVKINKDIDVDINEKDVLIVEDIIDTGLTLTYIRDLMEGRGAKSVKIVTAFDKPSRRKVELTADYTGITVPDEFIVGYGLDYNSKYRNLPESNTESKLTFSKLVAMLDENNVGDCPIESMTLKEGVATVKLRKDFADLEEGHEYKLNYDSVEVIENLLVKFSDAEKKADIKLDDRIKYDIATTSALGYYLLQMIPFILLIIGVIFVWYFMMNQANSGNNKAMSFGKSRARLATDNKKKITFNEVAGAAEEKQELEELVSFLKDPGKYSTLGARIPKGVLLVGPPGTGKTLLARAVAGEAGVPFFTISGSDFVEMYVGVGASRVRDLFSQAKKNAPCIVFIDEIDAVGRHRGAGLGGGHDEREQTLNQLLVEMDGFQMNDSVIIIAATNRKDILDPALLRPGRFDRQVYVNLPDVKKEEAILKVHARNKPLNDSVSLDEIAKTTPGFSGADLENLLNEAALIAARRNKKSINMEDVKEATFKLTAYHEAGHALAVRYKSTVHKVDRVSIIPAGSAGGYTSYRPDEDMSYNTRSQLKESIIVALAGKTAEELVFGDCSTGATNDLVHANKIARNMVTRLGMSDKIGNVILGDDNNEVFVGLEYGHTKSYSEELKSEIDREVKVLIDSCYEECKQLLQEHMDMLNKVSEVLILKERIEGDEFGAIIEGTWTEEFVSADTNQDAPSDKKNPDKKNADNDVSDSNNEVGH